MVLSRHRIPALPPRPRSALAKTKGIRSPPRVIAVKPPTEMSPAPARYNGKQITSIFKLSFQLLIESARIKAFQLPKALKQQMAYPNIDTSAIHPEVKHC